MNSIWQEKAVQAPAAEPEKPAEDANEVLTRAAAVEVLRQRENAEGEAIAWASEQGLITGYPDGSYKPNAPITRQELAVLLCRYSETKGIDTTGRGDLTAFADSAEISNWAADVVSWAVSAKLLPANGRLMPEGSVTRGELTQMLHWICWHSPKIQLNNFMGSS